MSKRQAFLVNAVVGCLLTWASVPLLTALGVDGRIQFVVAMLGLTATSFMVGVIAVHYDHKQTERGERPKRR